MARKAKGQKVQGEGDYEATRRYRKRTEEFLKNNDVEKAAVRAAPATREGSRGHGSGRGGRQEACEGRGSGAAPASRAACRAVDARQEFPPLTS